MHKTIQTMEKWVWVIWCNM